MLLVGVAGCSGGDGANDAARPTTSTSSTTSSTVASSTSTTTAVASTTSPVPSTTTTPRGSCTTGRPEVPRGAGSGAIRDVDGDGTADVGFMGSGPDGSRVVGIATSRGGGSTYEIRSASPVTGSMLVVNADRRGPVELLVDTGRQVELDAIVNCQIVPVTNPQGEPYLFDLGDLRGHGTGVGCIETPSGRRLVGLRAEPDASGRKVRWTRTIIELDGTHASNGATTSGTFARPADDVAIGLLSTVSCGDLTIQDDGIHERPA
jgi:hypothetical protein